jgi:predicted metal-dependent hydrolase
MSQESQPEAQLDSQSDSTLNLFTLGVAQFNQQHFYDCHETLEAFWKNQAMPEKELTQGIIQIAVGHHHLGQGNVKGALKLLVRGNARVQKFLPACMGLNLTPLHQLVAANVELLESGCSFNDPRLTIPIIENNESISC